MMDIAIDDKLLRMQLVSLRKAKHLTQKALADLAGLSVSSVSNIESSESVKPTMKSVIKYVNALGGSI